MPIVKVEHGLLEEENFYLASPVMDFLGNGSWSRTEERFRLKSGNVKRRLPYPVFMIDVKKEAVELTDGDYFEFFISADNGAAGIKEEAGNEPITDWRIAYYDKFIQVYASADNGLTWENKGGENVDFEGEIYQGFRKAGNQDLVITEYKVYRSPYLTLQNFQTGDIARLTLTNGSVLERTFDEWYECGFFLEQETSGSVAVYKDNECIFTSGIIEFTPGDVFLHTSDCIQLIYKERVLNYKTTELNTSNESFIIKNAGLNEAIDVHLSIINTCNDTVEISLDGNSWDSLLRIDKLEPNEEKEVLLRIIKDPSEAKFRVNHFDISIY